MPTTLRPPPSRWTAGSKTIELRKALERCTPRPELTHAQPQVTGLLTTPTFFLPTILFLVRNRRTNNRWHRFPVGFGCGPLRAHRAANVWAMVSRFAVSTPQPTHLPKPSSPLSRQRPRYSRRFMTLMRPSIPARNLLALLNHPCRSCSWRSVLFLPALGKHTFFTPICLATSSFSLECTLRSAATSSGTLPNERR